jgi:hypothetical protein
MQPEGNLISDRRKENRLNILFPAIVAWTDGGQEFHEQTTTFSISNSGAGILVRRIIPTGRRVRVTLDMGGLSGTAWAEVRWAQAVEGHCRIGVSFAVK